MNLAKTSFFLHQNLLKMATEPSYFDPRSIDDAIMDTFFELGFDFSSDQSDTSESYATTTTGTVTQPYRQFPYYTE